MDLKNSVFKTLTTVFCTYSEETIECINDHRKNSNLFQRQVEGNLDKNAGFIPKIRELSTRIPKNITDCQFSSLFDEVSTIPRAKSDKMIELVILLKFNWQNVSLYA